MEGERLQDTHFVWLRGAMGIAHQRREAGSSMGDCVKGNWGATEMRLLFQCDLDTTTLARLVREFPERYASS